MKSILAAESIPYTDSKDKFNKIKQELKKDRSVEVWEDEKSIYSAIKERRRKKNGR